MAYYRKPRNSKEQVMMNKLREAPPKAITEVMDFVFIVWRGTARDGSQARSEKTAPNGTIYMCVKDSIAVKIFDLQDMEHFSKIKGFEFVIAEGTISQRGFNFIYDIYDEGLDFARKIIKRKAGKETAKEKKARLKAEKEKAEADKLEFEEQESEE